MRPTFEELCRGNRYATTLYCINSAIVKLSKLTKATTVYRGVSGGVLPEQFWTPNAHNVRGGCEYGFLSTTTRRSEARRGGCPRVAARPTSSARRRSRRRRRREVRAAWVA